MPKPIDREGVQRLVAEGAQLVDVLPRAEYEEEHLAGAINISLKELNRETARQLDRSRPVIVYCNDYQWDLSPRAAWRLEAMGFEQVYDYEHGKRDWGSFGLPREGTATDEPSAGELARRDVPTCSLDDDLGEVCERVRAAGWDTCMVVNEQNVLLGRLGRRAVRRSEDSTVEAAMTEGPSTVRPSIGLRAIVERMRKNDLKSFPVTTSDGRLVGLVLRDEAESRLR